MNCIESSMANLVATNPDTDAVNLGSRVAVVPRLEAPSLSLSHRVVRR